MKNTLRKILCAAVSTVMLFTTAAATNYSTVYDINENNEGSYIREGWTFRNLWDNNHYPLVASVSDGVATLAMPTTNPNLSPQQEMITRAVDNEENFFEFAYWDDDENEETPDVPFGRISFKMDFCSAFQPLITLKDSEGNAIAAVNIGKYEDKITINNSNLFSGVYIGAFLPERDSTAEVIMDYDKMRIFFRLWRDGALKLDTENSEQQKATLIEYDGAFGIPFSNKNPISSITLGMGQTGWVTTVGTDNLWMNFDNISLSFYDSEMETIQTQELDTFPTSDVSLFDYAAWSADVYDATNNSTGKYLLANKINGVLSFTTASTTRSYMKKSFGKVSSGKFVAEFYLERYFSGGKYFNPELKIQFQSGDNIVASMTNIKNKLSDSVFNVGTGNQVASVDRSLAYVNSSGTWTEFSLYRFVFDLDAATYDVYVVDKNNTTHKLNENPVPFIEAYKTAGLDNIMFDTWAGDNIKIKNFKLYTIDDKSGNPEFASAGEKIESVSKSNDTVLPIYTGFIPEVSSASLIVATYNGSGAMKNVDIFDDELTLTENEWDFEKIEYTLPAALAVGDTIRVFVWDSVSGLVPYCGGSSISVVQ